MKINLEPRNESGHPAYWAAGRQRLATMTSVAIVDAHHLVCASLVGQALYLIEFDQQDGAYRLLDLASTVCEGRAVCTDLLDFDGRDLVATSNCDDSSVSFFRILGNRLVYDSALRMVGGDCGYVHGVSFVPGSDSDLVCTSIQDGAQCIQLWSRSSQALIARVKDPEWMPKQAVFASPTTMLVAYSQKATPRDMPATHPSKVALVEFAADYLTHRTLAEWPMTCGQMDSISYAGGFVFVNDQGRDQALRFRLDGDELQLVEILDGYDFPHGIHYDHATKLLAVSNYGSNSVDVRQLA